MTPFKGVTPIANRNNKNKVIKKKIHILLIGPVTNVQANLIGGATISFGYLVDYLNRTKQPFTLVNTQRFPKGIARLLNPLYILVKVFFNLFKSDVLFLNSSQGGTKYLAPIIFLFAKLFGKKMVFRPFGGNIKEYTAKYGSLQKWIFRQTILKADIFFLQTKALMQFYAAQNANTIQLPTSRDNPSEDLLRGDRPFKKRFLYLGFINEAKGVGHILEAAKQLGENYTIHVYGPVKSAALQQAFEINKGIYQGVLSKEEVLKTMSQYDVLMLPTFYQGEGYPGAIIEAYSLGIPVITTHWKSIPEIVQDGKTGQLIQPKSTDALVEAMQYFNTDNYRHYAQNARNYFLESFSTSQVNEQVMEQIRTLFISNQTAIKTN